MGIKLYFLGLFIALAMLLLPDVTQAQDPNFYIYLCFGQSNMEGQGTIETIDKTVDNRLQILEAVNCSNLGRAKGQWYPAIPPLCRCWSGLSPADYFGRTMVANLPDSIKIGLINVSVAGCKIELFDKNTYQRYVSTITEDWLKNIINEYDGNPYARLVEMAKVAQKSGVIKGILLHQGESNTGDSQWPSKVKAIYDNLISDLSLQSQSVPLLAGEVVHADQGGVCASMNTIIAKLPQTLPNSYVISSSGCTDADDNIHFNSAGYRKIGARYAIKMLALMGITVEEPGEPKEPVGIQTLYLEPECGVVGQKWEVVTDNKVSNGKYVVVKTGNQSLTAVPSGDESIVSLPVTIDSLGSYTLYGRLYCYSASNDSYWLKFDNNAYVMVNGIVTYGWQWKKMTSYYLTVGQHTLSIAFRESDVRLDKLCLTTGTTLPVDFGDTAVNLCQSDTTSAFVRIKTETENQWLEQNYPNPCRNETVIPFELEQREQVKLQVYNQSGVEVATIVDACLDKGKHTVHFPVGHLPNGVYLYTLKSNRLFVARKMLIDHEL